MTTMTEAAEKQEQETDEFKNECIFGLGTCPVLEWMQKRKATALILDQIEAQPIDAKKLGKIFQSLTGAMDLEIMLLSSFCTACATYNIKGRHTALNEAFHELKKILTDKEACKP